MGARVERNLARMLQPSYGWWILALIPGTYAVMVIAPIVFGDTSFVDALQLSPDNRGFLAVVVVGTLGELGMQQYLSRRAAHDEPGAPTPPSTAPSVGPANSERPARAVHARVTPRVAPDSTSAPSVEPKPTQIVASAVDRPTEPDRSA